MATRIKQEIVASAVSENSPVPSEQAKTEVIPEPLVSPAVEPAPVESAVSDSEEAAKTISVPLTADGKIAWAAIKRDSTRQRLRAAIGDGEGLKKADELTGLTKMAPALWMGVQALSTMMLTRSVEPGPLKSKIEEALAYSRGELELLAGPTAAVLQKYAPADLSKWSEEAALLMVVVNVHLAKFQTVKTLLQEAATPKE